MTLVLKLYDARWLLLAICMVMYVANKYWKYRKLQAFPGPFSTGWFELWHIRTILSTRSHLRYHEVSEKYGRIARIGPNELLTSSPELLVHMSTVRSPYTRSTWYNQATRMRPSHDHSFSQIDEEKHTRRRQQLSAGYSGKENLALESDIDARVQELLELLRKKYLSTLAHSNPVDIGEKIQFFTIDVISTVGFGEPIGDLKADADLNLYIKSSELGLKMMCIVGALGLTTLANWPPLARLIGPKETDKSGPGRMMFTARNLIDSRLKKPMEGRSDMMASFIRHGLSQDDLLTESLLQIVAGSDTTATTLRSTMLYLITHPQVFTRLRTEIDETVALGKVAGFPGIVSDATVKTLPYLQAVIREGLRVHPPVTDVVPKKVPSGGDKVVIDGKQVFLPGDTDISYSVWSVHHDREMFGEDADFFRPERWLLDEEHDLDRLVAMRRTTELIFGYGKYQCLGKPVAWMEINKVLFEFVRYFDWALATPDKPWRSVNLFGLFSQNEMWVTITERDQKV
ncbi:benzoate 4-monooxygenase cytochrome-like protein P450 [Phaeosphaeriaceae sp. PMI808]|nr:benzoate 4-monooxygenase cytochrome-like protein P450 [Phaeosphaeriaceae sp. PMI808]